MHYNLVGKFLERDSSFFCKMNEEFIDKIRPLIKLPSGEMSAFKIFIYSFPSGDVVFFMPFQAEMEKYYICNFIDIFRDVFEYDIYNGLNKICIFKLLDIVPV